VRRVCDSCAEPDVLEPGQAALAREELGDAFASAEFKRGSRTATTAITVVYQGRIGVNELVEIDDSMAVSLQPGRSGGVRVAVRAQPATLIYARVRCNSRRVARRPLDQVMRATFGLGD